MSLILEWPIQALSQFQSVFMSSVGNVRVFFAFHGNMSGPNLMKICSKEADISRNNKGQLLFRFVHR